MLRVPIQMNTLAATLGGREMEDSDYQRHAVTGHKLDHGGLPVTTFPRGRLCRDSGCATRLSIYNDSSYCAQHHLKVIPRMRAKRAA